MTKYKQTPNGCYIPDTDPPKEYAPPAAYLPDVDKSELDLRLQDLYRTLKFHRRGGACFTNELDPKQVFLRTARYLYGEEWHFDGEEWC